MRRNLSSIYNEFCEAAKTVIQKLASRKAIVFGFATHMTYVRLLEPEYWFTVACIYMGVQSALDWKALGSTQDTEHQESDQEVTVD